jgi:hypothetical protein
VAGDGVEQVLADYQTQTDGKSSARSWLATPAAKAIIALTDVPLRGQLAREIMRRLVEIAQPSAGGEANWWSVVGFSEPGAKWLSLFRAMLKEGPPLAQADLADVLRQMTPMAGSVMGDKDPTPQVIDAVERSLSDGSVPEAELKSALEKFVVPLRRIGNAAERRMTDRIDRLIAR